MKTGYLPLGILLALPASAYITANHGQTTLNDSSKTGVAYTERITESDLVRLRNQSQPFVSSTPGQSVAAPSSSNFADTTDFITFGGLTTFVPKGAVLHVPERIRDCMTSEVKGELVFWNTFLNRFPALVEPFEVTIQEAAGITEIKPDRLAAAARSERIIVTVIQGNPTSTNKHEDKNPSQKP